MNQQVLSHLVKNRDVFVEDLQELVRIPSIASRNTGMEACVQWIEGFLHKIGIEPIIERDASYPVFLIEIEGESPHSVLVYGHYDVQPASEDLWDYAPFGAEIVGDRMYGRGTVDDKGQILAALQAVRAYLECGKRPPLTVRFLVEGEEEIGSTSLKPVMEKHRDLLNCDGLILYDDTVWFDGRPRVVCGHKGALNLTFVARTNKEYHGMMFSMMPGPIWRLVWALGSLVDPSGKILIKDFYDDVVAPTEKELRAVQGLNWDATALLEEAGIREFPGGKSTPAAVESFVFDSTMGLSGIAGGYVYPERKSVVPSHATAIMRVALVPNQTAEQVVEKVRKHLDAHGFADIELEYAKTENSWARSPIDSPLALAMARSLEGAFGREVVFQPSFASSGPLGLFQKLFPGMDHAYSGFGPPESRVHAPNEYIIVDDYLRGIESVARFLVEYAEVIS